MAQPSLNIRCTEPVPHVALLTITREARMNALDTATRRQLAAELDRLDRDPDVRCIVITGEGERAFSAGGDLKEPAHHEPGALVASVLDRSWTDQLERGPQMVTPTIAAVRGHCVGAGLEVALACDVRIASEDASFCAPELRWGLIHGYGLRRLVAVVGLGRATHMMLGGEPVRGPEALAWGLATQVTAPDELLDAALTFAGRVAGLPPVALAISRELLRPAAGGADALSASRLAVLAAISLDEHVQEVKGFER